MKQFETDYLITPTHLHSHLPLLPHIQATQAKSKESASQRTGTVQTFLQTLTDIALNVNRLEQTDCKPGTTLLRLNSMPAANKGLKEMAGEVVNQTFAHLINSCGRLTVRASKPPLL